MAYTGLTTRNWPSSTSMRPSLGVVVRSSTRAATSVLRCCVAGAQSTSPTVATNGSGGHGNSQPMIRQVKRHSRVLQLRSCRLRIDPPVGHCHGKIAPVMSVWVCRPGLVR